MGEQHVDGENSREEEGTEYPVETHIELQFHR
jgi:hypothetical protein